MTETWATRWLDLAESSPTFDEQALRRGADYAAFDWQLDVDIHSGTATTTATTGRMKYEATVSVPVLSAEKIDDIVASIAAETRRMAAVLDGELPLDLDHVLDFDATDIAVSCSCRSIDQPCKHAAAVVHLVADAVADDPFDLLHLRGLARADLISQLAATRRGGEVDGPTEPATAVVEPPSAPALRWSERRGELPSDLTPPDLAGRLAPFPTPPPAGASFTESGLRMLADDAARRAAELLGSGNHGWTTLDATSDLARRAANAEGTSEWKGIVERAQVTSQELRARVAAWRAGGAAALSAHIAPVEIESDPADRTRQRRRTHDGTWVRFEKTKGRWLAVSVENSAEHTD